MKAKAILADKKRKLNDEKPNKAKRFKGNYHKCDKTEHVIRNCCHASQGKGKRQANLAERKDGPSNMNMTIVLFEPNLVEKLRE